MTLYPAPKPSRVDRIVKRALAASDRRTANQRGSRQKQRTDYGRAKDSAETWAQFKARIKARDGRRCVVRCGTSTLGTTVHHTKSVGSGGKNDEHLCVTLCAWCHQYWHEGHGPIRATVDAYLTRLYPQVPTDEECDQYTEELSRFTQTPQTRGTTE